MTGNHQFAAIESYGAIDCNGSAAAILGACKQSFRNVGIQKSPVSARVTVRVPSFYGVCKLSEKSLFLRERRVS